MPTLGHQEPGEATEGRITSLTEPKLKDPSRNAQQPWPYIKHQVRFLSVVPTGCLPIDPVPLGFHLEVEFITWVSLYGHMLSV